MASIKDLKKRITTVKNTQQTTRAMKMVSAAKLRRAQEAIQNQRPYAKKIGSLVAKLAAQPSMASSLHFGRDPDAPATAIGSTGKSIKKVLLVPVTSDRGLCGGFNGNVIKATQRWLLKHADSDIEVSLACVGRKGHDFFKTKRIPILAYYSEAGGKVTFLKAKKLAQSLVELYASGQVDEIKLIFNEFKNAVTQQTQVENLLPLGVSGSLAEPEDLSNTLVKPSLDGLSQLLKEKHFAIQMFRVLLESQAGEHGARMSAMENATKNAGEMIRKLTLQFNKQRQAGITKELLEIISGSESQKANA